MTDDQLDRLARACAEHVKAGDKIEIVVTEKACRKCGQAEYQLNSSPNWQNRWTCPLCKHSISR